MGALAGFILVWEGAAWGLVHTALSWWQNSDAENILFLKYEDLVLDFQKELGRIIDFLDLEIDERTRHHIQEKTSFSNMRSDQFSNMQEIEGLQGFFREGRIGSWRDRLTEEQNQRFDALIESRLGATGLKFDYV